MLFLKRFSLLHVYLKQGIFPENILIYGINFTLTDARQLSSVMLKVNYLEIKSLIQT